MEKSKFKSTIETKLQGHKNQYYILRVFDDKGNIIQVHTSKKLSYLTNLKKQRGY